MATKVIRRSLPVPPLFNAAQVDTLRMVKYGEVASAAYAWAQLHHIQPAVKDTARVCLMPIDVQITFCFPNAELPVVGALDDSNRTAQLIYQNLGYITEICPTFDTHMAHMIFHGSFWINDKGEHPAPGTLIAADDTTWQVNPAIAATVRPAKDGKGDYVWLNNYARSYRESLKASDKNVLIIWPYHAMLGGIGHALVPNVEEAIFFHSIARNVLMSPQVKGGKTLTENYSILSPEVTKDQNGVPISQKDVKFIEKLLAFDYVVILGQAKSHCVAWTINDLLTEIKAKDPKLANKVYLVEDCTSSVKIPDGKGGWVLDFTQQGNDAFAKFAKEGMHIVRSTTPMDQWPDMNLNP